MAWKVRTESFEGPFDLLLHLVSRQKLDIGSLSISHIADQYLAEVSRMEHLDLDVASDFLLVASTLLALKAESLLPRKRDDWENELEELSPSEAREILVNRLYVYKQFKNAAAALDERMQQQNRMHARVFGPDAEELQVNPDYLAGVTLDVLGVLAAKALARHDTALLESDHIAQRTVPLEVQVRSLYERLRQEKTLRFSQIAPESASTQQRVVAFLALLELYKRGMIDVQQSRLFGEIELSYQEGAGELLFEGDDALSSLKEDEA